MCQKQNQVGIVSTDVQGSLGGEIVVFKSAVDWWFYAVVVTTVLLFLVAAIPVVRTGSSMGMIVMALTGALGLGLPVWLLFSTHYTVTESELAIKSGPFKWRIERASIHYVTPSSSALSSPALSLKRLDIRYGEGQSVLVSPTNQDDFISALGVELR